VEIEIIELVMAETPSAESNYLEVSFAKAVKQRIVKTAQKRRNSVMRNREFAGDATIRDKNRDVERAPELRHDGGLDPEESIILRDLMEKASVAVTDPRDLDAVLLHYMEGWPVESLALHFNETTRQVKHRIKRALQQMRAALGVGTPTQTAAAVSTRHGSEKKRTVGPSVTKGESK
jgi:DNA-directed RNA polymerase specialized sigma24 family protein